jgi:hypothetical protein
MRRARYAGTRREARARVAAPEAGESVRPGGRRRNMAGIRGLP